MKNHTQVIRLLVRLLWGLLLLPLAASAASAQSGSETLTVGVPIDRCPIFYQEPDSGEVIGIGVDLMRAAAEEAGYTVRFRAVRELTLKDALDNPEYDVLMPFGSAIRSTAGQSSVVTENLFQTPFTFVTKGNREMPALGQLRVGMLRSLGGAIETLHSLFPDMEIREYDSMAESVKALRKNEVDALLHNSFVWSYVLQKPAYRDLTVQPSAMFSMDFRAGAPDTPEGRALVERLNRGIAAVSETRRQAVILDYTSRRLYRYDFSDYLYEYGLILLLGALLLAAVIVIAVQRLRAVRREQEETLRKMMDYDPLTGLLNMNGFRKRVEELLRTYPDEPYYLSYNNIRGFKFINDSLGREDGDKLLRFWAETSERYLSDKEAIARITADHFVVLRRIEGEEKMLRDEQDVFAPMENYFIEQGKENRVLICSGIYILVPRDFRKIDVDHMVDLARVAEKRARASLNRNYEFYNPEQWEYGKRVLDIANGLPRAIEDGEIQVWYQPQMDYDTGKITGAEALCRWKHGKLDWLSPGEFIPILEDAGLIYELDSYVWEQVCRDLQRWNAQGCYRCVSVNLSRDDIREGRDIPACFEKLVRRHGLRPEQLRIEITETAYAESPQLLIATTEKLRALGFQVEMDDFGSGYSSLHMLKEVPVDRVKLDLNFLTASGDQEKCRTIISSVISMVQNLGLRLISEGVETAEQARFLQSRGSSEMQGFYFYKPMPVQEFEEILAKNESA